MGEFNNNMRIIDGFDYTLQEKGNTYVALRKVQWYDQEEIKLDIRKYTTNTDGTEQIKSGVCLNDDGAHELTKVLVENGYGETQDILDGIKDRIDFKSSLKKSLSTSTKEELDDEFNLGLTEEDEEDEDEYYDIRGEMLA